MRAGRSPSERGQEWTRPMAPRAESPASGPLHMLQTELNGAKSQWEYLEDRIINGYKDAYKLHSAALKQAEDAHLEALRKDAQIKAIGMFVFSVVSVGFAGGLVGGIIAPWAASAAAGTAQAALRQGVQGIATRTTQQTVLRIFPEGPDQPSVSGSPYI